jgi:hypothetical protein
LEQWFKIVVKTFDCEKGYSYTITKISRRVPLEGMTLREFLELIGKQGRLITCMILSAPFLIPISIPGTGVVVGFIILIISLSIMLNKYYLVPDRLLNREMSHTNLVKVLNACFKILSFLEKYMKPRLKLMINKKFSSISNNFFLVISSILFIIPLPIPLTDTLPALGIFFLSAGILECDGYLILLGYFVVVITAIYFTIFTFLGLKIIFGFAIF